MTKHVKDCIGVGVVGIQTEGLIKVDNGPPVLTKHVLGIAPTVVKVSVAGPQSDGLIEVGDRLLVLT